MLFPFLGYGLGLRSNHYSDVLGGRSSVAWFEVVSENYMSDGGRPISILEKVRRDFPIALHGVALSIGSIDPLNLEYLKSLKKLIHKINPSIVSDHCCWAGAKGESLHDLMPLPFTEETLRYVVDRVKRVQDVIGQRILLENVSSYLTFSYSEMTEWEFLAEISTRADCGLLLDVNNVYVSSVNHSFNPLHFIQGLPLERVGQIHLAGHSVETTPTGRQFLIDTHDHPVCREVWSLYRSTIERFGKVSTLVEWDAEIPTHTVLEAEVGKAKKIEEQVYELSKATSKAHPIPSQLQGNDHWPSFSLTLPE